MPGPAYDVAGKLQLLSTHRSDGSTGFGTRSTAKVSLPSTLETVTAPLAHCMTAALAGVCILQQLNCCVLWTVGLSQDS
jgi:hypothetical protein